MDVMPDDDCVECSETQVLKTNKFEVDNTSDLFVGMTVSTNRFTSNITIVTGKHP